MPGCAHCATGIERPLWRKHFDTVTGGFWPTAPIGGGIFRKRRHPASLDRGRVKTLFASRCVSHAGAGDAGKAALSVLSGDEKGLSRPYCRHEWCGSEDLHRSLQIICKYMQTHLGTHAWQCFGQEVSCPHPHFERAERVLNGLSSYT